MKNLLLGAILLAVLWFIMDSGTDTELKQQYTLDLICALVTGSEAMTVEAARMQKILDSNNIVINESEVNSAISHWLNVYSVNSYSDLVQNHEFIMMCKYNACNYEGRGIETCIKEKIDTCFKYGISKNACIGE
ncbi:MULTISPECIES: hypothetical protein [Shewanella]|uniref:hypothetical protein n=1 Tax=Shewanella TaxID=22 RepID=UPI000D136E0E|nr:hypothetical protein [Shewanella algae]MBO2663230.1 hypothetical protein [Shewanella algae]MCL1054641.1 hypothetical protein [Shewanella algae]PSS69554.1 hypothetical protein AYI85_08185 [Shewanella algae]TVL01610.1 hypothetical protein AYI84_15055 [Shewanella algae]TVL45545.1 hypothetical protein AYI99_12045 [Shewanella algae]